MRTIDSIKTALFSASLLSIFIAGQAIAFEPDEAFPDVEQSTAMTTEELTQVFKGKKHLGTYNFLTRDITSFAFEETTAADGSIRHVQEDKIDTGQWKITNGTICYNYDDPALRQACFKIYPRGNCYYHYQVSTEGRPQFGFTARSVIAGDTPNCEPSYV